MKAPGQVSRMSELSLLTHDAERRAFSSGERAWLRREVSDAQLASTALNVSSERWAGTQLG